MGISPTDTAHGYRYTQEWLNSSSSNQGTSSAQQHCDQHEEGLAARLYSSCRRVLRDLCWQEQTSPSRTSQSLFLRDELMKFYLWGQSFGPGELDTALEHSDDARYLVLEALRVIGQSLLRETSQLFDTDYDDQRSQELRYLVEQTQAVVSVQREEIGDASSDDSYGTDEDGRLDDHDASDVVQELKSQICYLVELGPTLQQNVLYARKARTGSSFPPLVPFHLSDPAKVYVSLIREKYRTAEDQLVDRLGESNWQRHKMVRERMDTTKSYPGRADGHVEEIPAIEDRNDLYSAFRPYSAFHDSGIGTSVPAHTIYAPSHTSFQSTNFEGDQGSVRVPSTPEEVSAGKPFQCPLCGDLLTNVRNRIEWKMHVFADLRPYICTFANCEKELAQFTTREAWANHELMDHRILRSWACPECAKPCNSELAWVHHLEGSHQQTFTGPKKQIAQKLALTTQAKPIESEACPLCGVISGMSRREFVKHLGRHMEEIALMALPRDHDEESEADSANTESDEADTSVKNVFTACEPSCGKCGRTRITNAQGETGSAGELKSVFCQCADGGHEWKFAAAPPPGSSDGANGMWTRPSTPNPDEAKPPTSPAEPLFYMQHAQGTSVTYCPLCIASFSGNAQNQASNLGRHLMTVHHNSGLHVCTEPGCNRVCRQSDDLRKHRRSAHNIENHIMRSSSQPASYQSAASATLGSQTQNVNNDDTSIRPRLTYEQVSELEEEFLTLPMPDTDFKKNLANRVGLTLALVNNWYQNRRAKSKNEMKTTEVQYEFPSDGLLRRREYLNSASQDFSSVPYWDAANHQFMSLNGDAKVDESLSADRPMVEVLPIAKAPRFVRPNHQKIQCTQCNVMPDGFRGEDELRRHIDQTHAMSSHKAFVCVDISPKKDFLAGCKACDTEKRYNRYDKAAAHLRRVHFQTKKEGSKVKFKPKESQIGNGEVVYPIKIVVMQWIAKIDGTATPNLPLYDDHELEDDNVFALYGSSGDEQSFAKIRQQAGNHSSLQPKVFDYQSTQDPLQDCQMQPMLLEQQEKQGKLMARQKPSLQQDNLKSSGIGNNQKIEALSVPRDVQGATLLSNLEPASAISSGHSQSPVDNDIQKGRNSVPNSGEAAIKASLTADESEYIYGNPDENGERKISAMGDLLGGREFRIRTFYSSCRGKRLFMLATRCAEVLGYRGNTYLFFNEYRSLIKINTTQAEKDDLISRGILSYPYRSHEVSIVTARSIFRQFGAQVIKNGRHVRDDYWEKDAVQQGFTDDDLAVDGRFNAFKTREPTAATVHGRSAQNPGRPAVQIITAEFPSATPRPPADHRS